MQSDIKSIFNYGSKLSIVVGENGSGKSKFLSELVEYYISSRREVIAVSNCIYDKFGERGRKYHFIGCRYGERFISVAIFRVIKMIAENDEKRFLVGKVLDYLGYSTSIGILYKKSRKIKWFDLSGILPSFDFDVNDGEDAFYDVHGIYLNKDNVIFPMESASSGEIQLLSSFSFMGSNVSRGAVIIIDEPENSLHPRWQKKYISQIFDLFHLYEVSVVIATHSPMIISGIGLSKVDGNVYSMVKGSICAIEYGDKNIELIMWNIFKIITPESPFLSRYISDLINSYVIGNLTFTQLTDEFSLLKESCVDERQVHLINASLSLANNAKYDLNLR